MERILNNKFYLLLGTSLVSVLLYATTIGHPFLFDDIHLKANRALYHLSAIPSFFLVSYHFIPSGAYRPVAMLSYAVNQALFGSSVASFRIFQILLYALNGALFYWCLVSWSITKRVAGLATLLFLFHPLNSNVVAVAVFRHDMLFVTFGWLAMLARHRGKLPLTYLCLLLSLLSKETGIIFIGLQFYYLLWIKSPTVPASFWQRLWAIRRDIYWTSGILSFYFLLRFQALQQFILFDPTTIVENPLRHLPAWSAFLTALQVIGLYTVKLIYPRTLTIDNSYNQIIAVQNLASPLLWLGIASLVASLLVIIPRFRIGWPYRLAALLFLLPLLPVANLFFKIGAIYAERWLYLPTAGFALLLATIGEPILRRPVWRWLGYGGLLILLGLYGLRVWARNQDWRDQFALYASTAAASPRSVLARNNYAAMFLLNKNYPAAKTELAAADAIYPYYPQLLLNWGIYYQAIGERQRGIEYFQRLITQNPEYVDAYSYLIGIYVEQEDYPRAVQWAKARYQIDSRPVWLEQWRYLETLK